MEKTDFIITEDETGKHAVREGMAISVLDPGETRIVHRRTITPFKSGSAIQSSVLVCQLGDVYLYIGADGNMVMTKNGGLA